MTVLSFSEPVLLIGAGPVSREDFDFARDHAGAIVAVDGGFDQLAAWGIEPSALLGDMDSIKAAPAEGVCVVEIKEQDSTDLEKALQTVEAPVIIGVGFLGARLDHTLAAMHALVGYPVPAILLGERDVVFAAPTEWRAELDVGVRVSFYPVRRVQAVGSKGLRWPLDGLLLDGGRAIAVSNETVSAHVAAWFAERGAVTILPREWLAAAIASVRMAS